MQLVSCGNNSNSQMNWAIPVLRVTDDPYAYYESLRQKTSSFTSDIYQPLLLKY